MLKELQQRIKRDIACFLAICFLFSVAMEMYLLPSSDEAHPTPVETPNLTGPQELMLTCVALILCFAGLAGIFAAVASLVSLTMTVIEYIIAHSLLKHARRCENGVPAFSTAKIAVQPVVENYVDVAKTDRRPINAQSIVLTGEWLWDGLLNWCLKGNVRPQAELLHRLAISAFFTVIGLAFLGLSFVAHDTFFFVLPNYNPWIDIPFLTLFFWPAALIAGTALLYASLWLVPDAKYRTGEFAADLSKKYRWPAQFSPASVPEESQPITPRALVEPWPKRPRIVDVEFHAIDENLWEYLPRRFGSHVPRHKICRPRPYLFCFEETKGILQLCGLYAAFAIGCVALTIACAKLWPGGLWVIDHDAYLFWFHGLTALALLARKSWLDFPKTWLDAIVARVRAFGANAVAFWNELTGKTNSDW